MRFLLFKLMGFVFIEIFKVLELFRIRIKVNLSKIIIVVCFFNELIRIFSIDVVDNLKNIL